MVTREWVDDEGNYIMMTDGDVWERVFVLLDTILPTDDAVDVAQAAADAFKRTGFGRLA